MAEVVLGVDKETLKGNNLIDHHVCQNQAVPIKAIERGMITKKYVVEIGMMYQVVLLSGDPEDRGYPGPEMEIKKNRSPVMSLSINDVMR